MSIINIKNLSFSYNSYHNVFDNLSATLDSDWKLGLIGRNGAGKTTLFNLLLNKYSYSGEISTHVEFQYFPLQIDLENKKTIEIINSFEKEEYLWKIEFSKLKIDLDILERDFKTLSYGEQTKVLLALLFINDDKFLLIDEPTNHLDFDTRKIISDYLKQKKGFILATHDRMLLDNCVNHIMAINKSSIDIQKGNFSSWDLNRKNLEEFEKTKNEKLKKEIKTMKVAFQNSVDISNNIEKTKYGVKFAGLRPDRGYIGHKSAKVMKKAKNYENRMKKSIQEKEELFKDLETVYDLKLSSLDYHKQTLVEFLDVSFFYGKKTILSNICFAINKEDRISLIGKNGSGKTTILKSLINENINYTGSIIKNDNLVISFVHQETDHLKGNLSDFIYNNKINETLFRAILNKFNLLDLQMEKNIENYSSGQKKKLLIAQSLSTQAHLYVWDEPLNYIDIISRIQIESLILKYKPTIIFVEHDNYFSDKIATKKIYL